MSEALLGKLVLVLSRATPGELAAIYHFATGEPWENAERGARSAELKCSRTDGSSEASSKAGPAYVFRWTGRDWQVVFGGGEPFHLENTLGARCADYLLHHPNDPIASFDLEVEVQPQKKEARARNSIQTDSDPRALREYREELRRLQSAKERAQAAGKEEESARLEQDIQALESALRGGGPADTGQRAYDNVRKAFGVLTEHLRQGGPAERAFAEHLRSHLSLGLECLYSQPDGRIWA